LGAGGSDPNYADGRLLDSTRVLALPNIAPAKHSEALEMLNWPD